MTIITRTGDGRTDSGVVTGVPNLAGGLAAKARISTLLDLSIDSVESHRRRTEAPVAVTS